MQSAIEEFVPLARLTLSGAYDDSECERWVRPLAQLLEAASRGKGQLSLSDCAVPPDAPSEFFAIEGNRVLLPRYAAFWREVRARVQMLQAAPSQRWPDSAVREALDAILPAYQESVQGRVLFDNAQQRLAVAAFVDARVGVLTGAPGTGKTTSAAALLAIRKRLEPSLCAEHVLLCAPTGEAACRLVDSMRAAAQRLSLTEREREFLCALGPQTIHRALEWGPRPPEQGGPFRRGSRRPLPQRLVIVDEASMVDLHLMAHLLRALGPAASIFLLGDRDQLESVDTGGVLAEMVASGTASAPSAEQLQRWRNRLGAPIEDLAPDTQPTRHEQTLPGLVVSLRHSHRAKSAPWIVELAGIAKPGLHSTLTGFVACCQRSAPNIRLHERRASFVALCLQRWQAGALLTATWNAHQPPDSLELLRYLRRDQLLCATNAQVSHANRLGVTALWGGAVAPGGRELPHGCPVLVTQNTPALGLSNGDIGVALGHGKGRAARVVVFPGCPSPIPVAQLPQHLPAFALTIHKSQGSEWERVAIELPNEGDVLDRNLLYTAITRSSGKLDLFVNDLHTLGRILERWQT